jgi:hypothetical protein
MNLPDILLGLILWFFLEQVLEWKFEDEATKNISLPSGGHWKNSLQVRYAEIHRNVNLVDDNS